MAAPTVVLVPGLWVGPTIWDLMRDELAKIGPELTDVHTAALASTGTTSPGIPSMHDDIKVSRAVLQPLVKAGKRVVVAAHSAAGLLASNAVEDLEIGGKATGNGGGGVARLVFIAGDVAPTGFRHHPLPFMDFQNDRMFCKDPEKLLFNDVPPEVAMTNSSHFRCQPSSGWDDTITCFGWTRIPSTYLLCEADALLSPDLQRTWAQMAKSEIVACNLGH